MLYTYLMNIQKISTGNPLMNVPAEAAMRVEGMALSNQKQQGAALVKLLNSAQMITDPALGNQVNILA